MTDQELIAVLTRKFPEDLTLEETETLLRRLSESPELRQVLAEQIPLEAYLAEAIARSGEQAKIEAEAAEKKRKSSPAATVALVALVALPLLAVVAVVSVSTLWPSGDELAGKRAPDEKSPPSGAAADAKQQPDPAATVADAKSTKSKGKAAAGGAPPAAGKSNPPAVAKLPPPPWQAALEMDGEPLPFTDVAFRSFEQSFDVANKDDLTPWFEKTPNAGLRLGKLTTQFGKSGTIEGIGRLKCPWPEDGVLRLQLDNYNRLRMHFFHGLEGLTLIYYEDQNYRWAAYATTREADKPTPKTWAIAATDDDRCRRSELRFGGPIELRYRSGELILSRGDIVLLTVPLPGSPTDVFFEGRATFNGISLVRVRGVPALLPPAPIVADIQRPAELPWTATQPEIARGELLADGGVRLAAEKVKQRAECYTPLPQQGLNEVILELGDIMPGAGVYLGRENGAAQEVLRFVHDKRSDQLAARLRRKDDEWEVNIDSPADKPAPLVQPHCWVKLLYGCGNLRWWLSSDGIHWAQPEFAADKAPPNITSIGLQVVAHRPDCRLTLRRIVLRNLTGLTSLADTELVGRAPAVISTKSLEEWRGETLKQKPADTDAAEWLRAASIRTLAAGAPRELAYPLLESLLDDAATRGLPVEQQLAALDHAALLCLDYRDGQAMRSGVLSRLMQLGVRASDEQGLPAWTTVRQHYQAVPLASPWPTPTDLDRAIRWELVEDAYRGNPQQTLDFLSKLRFFQQHRDRPLADWVESLAHREAPGQPAGETVARHKESWREPLIEELSKDTYNAMTELRAVLESESWDDAAKLVTSLDPDAAPGVAPFVNDKALLTSLPVAVQLTLEEFPQLRQSLGDRFGALARLRIGQAVAAGDAAAIELATVQFAGTEAAAEAHRWLGDRALASGWFARAITEYERAGRTDPSLSAESAPRIRLAAAMLGRDAGEPVTRPVQFGEVSLSVEEFEKLISEMRGRGASAGLTSLPEVMSPPSVPPPSGFTSQVRSRLDGPVGDRPQEEVGRRTNQYRIPWADRQIATLVLGDVMYVANRFQVAAYDLTNGLRTWRSQPPAGPMQRAQDWAMIPMQPLIVGDRIFVRQLYSSNPVLVCLEKSSGKLLWTAENRDREYLVSDPMFVQGQLVALGMAIQQEQQGQLRWCVFDPQTGELLRERELVRLRNTWGARGCCQVTPLEDGLIAVLGGITLAVDAEGSVRWIRTHVTLPAEEDPRWLEQTYQPPLVRGERVYVAQPGVRNVDCLSAATGRQLWNAVLPEAVGIVGLSRDLLIVRTETDMRALDAASGTVRWRYSVAELFSFQLLDNDRLLIAQRERMPEPGDRWQTRLTWLDPATGKAMATTPLAELSDSDPRLGPFVQYKGRIFAFFGRGQHDPTRDVVELLPRGEADTPPVEVGPWFQSNRAK